jgi:hypothetical protein
MFIKLCPHISSLVRIRHKYRSQHVKAYVRFMLLTHCYVSVSMARLSFLYIESYTWSSCIQKGTQLLRCDYKSGYTSAPEVFRFVDVSCLVKLLSKIRGSCYFRMFSENNCGLLGVYWAQNMYVAQLSVSNISLS